MSKDCYIDKITLHVSIDTNICDLINMLERVKDIDLNATVNGLDYYDITFKVSGIEQ